MKWNDATSYHHGERGKVEPKVWEATDGSLRLIVVRMRMVYSPDVWSARVQVHEATVAAGDVGPHLDAAKVGCVTMACAAVADLSQSLERMIGGGG